MWQGTTLTLMCNYSSTYDADRTVFDIVRGQQYIFSQEILIDTTTDALSYDTVCRFNWLDSCPTDPRQLENDNTQYESTVVLTHASYNESVESGVFIVVMNVYVAGQDTGPSVRLDLSGERTLFLRRRHHCVMQKLRRQCACIQLRRYVLYSLSYIQPYNSHHCT